NLSVRLIVPDAREHRDRHTAVPAGREEQPLDVPVADFGAESTRPGSTAGEPVWPSVPFVLRRVFVRAYPCPSQTLATRLSNTSGSALLLTCPKTCGTADPSCAE